MGDTDRDTQDKNAANPAPAEDSGAGYGNHAPDAEADEPAEADD